MAFAEDGFEIRKGWLDRDRLNTIRRKMVEIMRPYCSVKAEGADDLDACFAELSAKDQKTKSNCYTLFSKLADLPLMLTEPNISDFIREQGFENYTIQAYSVFCIEPNDDRHLFLPHQDLVARTSLRTLQFWIPLSSGKDIGGVAVWGGTQKYGPQHHEWRTDPNYRTDPDRPFQKFAGAAGRRKPFGALVLPEKFYAEHKRVDMVDYEIGDCLILTPYTVHGSIPNRGKGMRWTFVIKIEDASNLQHLSKDTSPFPMNEYLPPFPGEVDKAEEQAFLARNY